MKKWGFLFFIFCTLIQPLFSEDLTAREIIEEQNERHKSTSEYTEEKMALLDAGGNQEIRSLRKYSKKLNDDESRFLLVFDSPKAIKGTALLTWINAETENDQWMYLPAQKRLQRIAKGSKKGYFMGTDFTYEDMEPEDSDNFDYTIVRSEKISNLDCWVIKAEPNNEETLKASGYKWRLLYVLKKYFFTVKIDFFDKQEKMIKTQINGKLVRIDGQRYRTNKAVMTNHTTNHKTVIETASREIDIEIMEVIFTENYITSGRHIK